MKHDEPLTQLALWLGLDLSPGARQGLEVFAAWLRDEAIPAGLLSPAETGRLWSRHILDAVAFVAGFDRRPATLVDIGSGAGLPGIPLAIVWPETRVSLLERSTTRARLLRRIVRLLDLSNTDVVVADARRAPRSDGAVMRAVFQPWEAAEVLCTAIGSRGTGVLGLSRRTRPDPAWERLPGEVRKVGVLDPPAWLLIMSGCET